MSTTTQRLHRLAGTALLLALVGAGCTGPGGSDGGDGGSDARGDAVTTDQASDVLSDSSADARPDARDATADSEAGADAQDASDASDDAQDASGDGSVDASGDASDDAQEASADASSEASPDAADDAQDASVDAALDASVDAQDAAADAQDASDVGPDVAPPECTLPTDCTGMDTECRARTCILGRCGVSFASASTVVAAQTPADCQENRCDGAGNVVSVANNADSPADDGNQCTGEVCVAGVPTHPNSAAGAACTQGGGTRCNGAGMCVGCLTASDCPGSDTACGSRVCNAGVCGRNNVAAGTAIASQTPGDCQRNQCDGAGNVVSVADNSDVPADDGQQCTSEVCTAGVPSHPNASAGTACTQNGGSRCDGAGTCVGCVTASDCPGSDTACGSRVCSAGVCGRNNTAAGTPTTSQTPGDCQRNQCDGAGNIVSVADNSDVPADDGNSCTSDVCNAGVPSHPNVPAGSTCSAGGGAVCNGAGMCVGCVTASDCPGSDTACGSRVCNAGVCGRNNVAAGTAIASQTPGDCQRNQCDGAGNVVSVADNSDVPADDGRQCTSEVCTAGVPSHPSQPAGTACSQSGGTVCDGAGTCVGCLTAASCPGSDTECRVRTCVAGVCGATFIAAGTAVASQTPGDCHRNQCDGAGNIVNSVDDTDVPVDGNQCTSDVCTAGAGSNPPTAPRSACSMSGTLCDGTGVCVQCLTSTDCASGGRCTGGMCAAPSCTDGLRNGTETDTDCGGATCSPCRSGLRCTANRDCATGVCNGSGVCESTLAVLRVGDGSAALTSAATAVFVEYYSLAGALLRTATLPVTVSGTQRRLLLSGTATSEGALSTSADGRYVVLGGYDAAAGTASIASSAASTVNRVVGRLDRVGGMDTSTALGMAFSGGNIRGATSSDGSAFWAVGSTGGVFYELFGDSTSTAIATNFLNIRTAGVSSGQLYVSGSSGTLQGVATVGTGLPTTTGQTITTLPGFPTASGPSPYAFVFAGTSASGMPYLYVADDRTSGPGGIQRWSNTAGTWSLDFTLSVGTSLGTRGVTAVVSGGVVTLYATTTSSTTGAAGLVSIVDNGTSSTPTTLQAVRANMALRGVTLAPYAP